MNATQKTNGIEAVKELPKRSLLDEIVDENRIAGARYMPVMSPKQAQARMVAIQELKDLCLVSGVDYGPIPGTGADAKPVLLKPGAEKICAYFGYVPKYEVLAGSIEDWDGHLYGEPLFFYHITCLLSRDKSPVGEGSGSCSTWERKYRYRTSKRSCPACGQQQLIKGKPDFERDAEYKRRGAWICFEKKGGCGAKYFMDDPAIMNQPLGDVANPDFADIINTVRKMADKRAYIAATLSATGASQWFTQDLEPVDDSADVAAKFGVENGSVKSSAKVADQKIANAKNDPPPAADIWRKGFMELALKAFDTIGEAEFNGVLQGLGYDTLDKVQTPETAKAFIEALRSRTKALNAHKTAKATAPTPEPAKADPPAPFAATDDDLPGNIAAAPDSTKVTNPAENDEVYMADLRHRIEAYKKQLGHRYQEIIDQYGLKSLFGLKDFWQAEEVLEAMSKAAAKP